MTTLALVCSPNMGIVDSWLPVLIASRERHPDWRIVAIVPRAWNKDLDASGAVLGIADRVLSEVVVEVAEGVFLRCRSFAAAQAKVERTGRAAAWAEQVDDRWASRLARRAHRRAGADAGPRPVSFAVGRWMALRHGRARVALEGLGADGSLRVCHDIEVSVRKPESARVLRRLGPAPRFSLSHGLGVPDSGGGGTAGRAAADASDVRVYAHGPLHDAHYRSTIDLPPGRVVVTGVPRHDPAARDAIVERSKQQHPIVATGAVLLVSRPATSSHDLPSGPRDWLPRGRRLAQLRTIDAVVRRRYGLPLLVSRHPKERDDGSFAHVFGAPEDGPGWQPVQAHPLHLAEHIRFAISFSSGVAADLLVAGVPTIEFQDVSGATAYDHDGALRDERGRVLRTSERRHGIVLPADDAEDLAAQIARVLAEGDDVMRELRAAYLAMYAEAQGAVDRIVTDLAQDPSWPGPPQGRGAAEH